MKITLNIQKRHLYYLLIFLVIMFVGIVIATGYNGQQSHSTLFTDAITGKSGSTVTLNDDLQTNGKVTITKPGTYTQNSRLELMSTIGSGGNSGRSELKIYDISNPNQYISVYADRLGTVSPLFSIETYGSPLELNSFSTQRVIVGSVSQPNSGLDVAGTLKTNNIDSFNAGYVNIQSPVRVSNPVVQGYIITGGCYRTYVGGGSTACLSGSSFGNIQSNAVCPSGFTLRGGGYSGVEVFVYCTYP